MNGRGLLAWNVRRLRVARDIAQERLAADAGVDRAYLSKVERADANPTIDLMDRLAATLGVSVAELLAPPIEGSEPPQPLRSGRRPSS